MSWSEWQPVADSDFSDIIYEKKHHLELEGGIARITVNRPHRRNAMTGHTMDEMFHAFYDASHDAGIGVVVLTGAGDHFGSGGDVEWEEKELRVHCYWRMPPDHLLRMCRKPVIAAVKGWCIGGSNHMAYMCDFTIAADTARFGQNGPRVGSPADGYVVSYLTRVVGAKKAREIWMLCRKYDAQAALEMGLVNTVVPVAELDDEVDRWSEEILSLSPGCVEVLKASFDADIDYLAGQWGHQSRLLYPDWFSEAEAREGPRAFMEKRTPRFWKARKSDAALRTQAREQVIDEMGLGDDAMRA